MSGAHGDGCECGACRCEAKNRGAEMAAKFVAKVVPDGDISKPARYRMDPPYERLPLKTYNKKSGIDENGELRIYVRGDIGGTWEGPGGTWYTLTDRTIEGPYPLVCWGLSPSQAATHDQKDTNREEE